jgi:hypothetical protein
LLASGRNSEIYLGPEFSLTALLRDVEIDSTLFAAPLRENSAS